MLKHTGNKAEESVTLSSKETKQFIAGIRNVHEEFRAIRYSLWVENKILVKNPVLLGTVVYETLHNHLVAIGSLSTERSILLTLFST